jgi:S-formylglutathione hydrolase
MSDETQGYIDRFNLADPVHGEVACIEIGPRRDATLPVCIFLYGGGGTCESLLELEPLLAQAWRRGVLPGCRIVTPDAGPWDFYLDSAQHGSAWESFVAERLLSHIHGDSGVAAQVPVGLVGISMGGYGALKMALARPRSFRAVAAVAPMVEPSFTAAAVRLRNRYHYPPQVPTALLGSERDASLYAADHPACRAVHQAEALRTGALALYLDAGTADALNAHDGTEFLHRVLWDLDVEHDYRLWAGADHVGPSLIPRLEAAFCWLGSKLINPTVALTPLELDWQRWLDAGATGEPPPPLSPTSPLMPRVLRTMLAPLRDAARSQDETMDRRFGVLPSTVASPP